MDSFKGGFPNRHTLTNTQSVIALIDYSIKAFDKLNEEDKKQYIKLFGCDPRSFLHVMKFNTHPNFEQFVVMVALQYTTLYIIFNYNEDQFIKLIDTVSTELCKKTNNVLCKGIKQWLKNKKGTGTSSPTAPSGTTSPPSGTPSPPSGTPSPPSGTPIRKTPPSKPPPTPEKTYAQLIYPVLKKIVLI